MSKKRKRQHRKTKTPNYMRELEVLAPLMKKEAGLYFGEIRHDDWCEFFKGGSCNCNPDYVFDKYTGEKKND
jgi:hypothetical protein